MTKRSHAIYIASEEWELRKQRYYETHARECARCGPPGDDIFNLAKPIHLHHLSYAHKGYEPDIDLMPLCEVCHSAAHAYHAKHKKMNLYEATRYALGFDTTTPIPAHLVGTRRAKPKKKIATRANGPKKSPAAQRASRVKRTEEEERYMKQGAHQRSLGSSVY